MRSRLALVASVSWVLGGGALADEIDRSSYHDLPAGWQAIIDTIPVNPDDNVSEEVRQNYAGHRPYGEYMVYYGADGAIDAIDVAKPIAGCDEFVETWIRAHEANYRPGDHGRVRRLARVEVSFPPLAGRVTPTSKPQPSPAAPGTRPKNVLPYMLDTQAIEREPPHLPDAVREKHPGGTEIAVSYYVTIGTDGRVSAVDPLAPAPDIDPAITATLKRWRFKTQPIPIRTMLRFVFTIPPRKWH